MVMKQSMQVLTSSNTAEWYTPPDMVGLVREVIGEIELDPAGNEFANTWINAERMFTPPDNGLEHKWVARSLYMNSPYGKYGSKSSQEIWMNHLISQLGTIGECIALTKATPGYFWWDDLFNGKWPGPLCITSGRISFVGEDGEIHGKSKAASSLWYYGKNARRFEEVFSSIGRVLPPKKDLRLRGV